MGKKLNLKKHVCGVYSKNSKTLCMFFLFFSFLFFPFFSFLFSNSTLSTLSLLGSAADVEGHKGEDGKFYLLDFSRTFPPVNPDERFILLLSSSSLFIIILLLCYYYSTPLCLYPFSIFFSPFFRFLNGHLYQLFRREFVEAYHKPLCR